MPAKCKNCSATTNLHSLPKDKELAEIWKEIIPYSSEIIFNRSFKLCSAHFENKYVTASGRLCGRVVPSKFLSEDGQWFTIEYKHDINPKYARTEDLNYLIEKKLSAPKTIVQKEEVSQVEDLHNEVNENASDEADPLYISLPFTEIASSVLSRNNTLQSPIEKVKDEDLSIKKHFRYVGDIDLNADLGPESLKRALKMCTSEIFKFRRTKRLMRQKITRMNGRISKMENFLKELASKGIISRKSLKKMEINNF